MPPACGMLAGAPYEGMIPFEPLHLTEENKATIRALVTRLTRAELQTSQEDKWPKLDPESYYDWANRGAHVSSLVQNIYNSSPLFDRLLKNPELMGTLFGTDIYADGTPQSHAEMKAEMKRIEGERQKAHKVMLRKLDAERIRRIWRGEKT